MIAPCSLRVAATVRQASSTMSSRASAGTSNTTSMKIMKGSPCLVVRAFRPHVPRAYDSEPFAFALKPASERSYQRSLTDRTAAAPKYMPRAHTDAVENRMGAREEAPVDRCGVLVGLEPADRELARRALNARSPVL